MLEAFQFFFADAAFATGRQTEHLVQGIEIWGVDGRCAEACPRLVSNCDMQLGLEMSVMTFSGGSEYLDNVLQPILKPICASECLLSPNDRLTCIGACSHVT